MEKREIMAAILAVVVALILTISMFVVIPALNSRIPKEVSVVFSETGLRAGQIWKGSVTNYIEVNNTDVARTIYFSTSTGTFTVNVTNYQGRMFWSVNSSSWYDGSPSYGYVTSVTGHTVKINEKFLRLYVLTFNGNGKPVVEPGNLTLYSIDSYRNLTNYGSVSYPMPIFQKSNTTISFKLVNGTYYYQLITRYLNNMLLLPVYNKTVNLNGFAEITVSGKNLTSLLGYTTHTHSLYVSEQGFPSNRPGWNFSIDGSQSDSYSNHAGGYYNMRFQLPDGTYQYAAESIGGFQGSNGVGSVTINGTDVTLVIRYG